MQRIVWRIDTCKKIFFLFSVQKGHIGLSNLAMQRIFWGWVIASLTFVIMALSFLPHGL